MKKLIGTLLITLVFLLINGCSSASYAIIVVINGEEYYGQGLVKNNNFTVKEKIGEVEQKTDVEKVPKEEWSSNALDEGTEIYSTNEKENVYLFETDNGEYQILTKEAKDAE